MMVKLSMNKMFMSFFIFLSILTFPVFSETLVLSMSLDKHDRDGFEIINLIRQGDIFYSKEEDRTYLILHEDERDLILFYFNPESSSFKSRSIMINKKRKIWSNTNNTVPLIPMTNDNWMTRWGTLTIK